MSKKPDDFQVETGGVSAMLSGLSDRFGTETPDQSATDGTTARRRNGTTASRTKQPAPPAPAPKPSKYTLLLDQDDALALDQLALTLRRHTGRPVDKSEILRALIRLTATDDQATRIVAQALDRPAAT